MGKKKKAEKKEKKKLRKLLRKQNKALHSSLASGGCKTKCCEKFSKGEDRRCKRCPCYDLMKKVA